ncbi:hypothetical protein D3C71_1955330 [compost metagenome]
MPDLSQHGSPSKFTQGNHVFLVSLGEISNGHTVKANTVDISRMFGRQIVMSGFHGVFLGVVKRSVDL